MNDRELLELAAKAAGYEVVERHDFNGLIINVPGIECRITWTVWQW